MLGGYGQAVNQVGGLADIYNQGYQQQLGRAGLYGNVANMAQTGAGLYGAGMGLLNQNITNRRHALDFGYNANMDLTRLGLQRAQDLNAAIGGYGGARAGNAIAQGNIAGNAIANIAGLAGGALGNYLGGNAGGLFGGGGSNDTSPLFDSMFGNTKPMRV